MSEYDLEAKYSLLHSINKLDAGVIDKLWNLYLKICMFWDNTPDPEPQKPDFMVFISNRIEIDPRYVLEYLNYAEVITEMIGEMGEGPAFNKLFTDYEANLMPPVSKLARARQMVVNELIGLNLALGGFKGFGDSAVPGSFPVNYPGYIGGMNLPNNTPYRI